MTGHALLTYEDIHREAWAPGDVHSDVAPAVLTRTREAVWTALERAGVPW